MMVASFRSDDHVETLVTSYVNCVPARPPVFTSSSSSSLSSSSSMSLAISWGRWSLGSLSVGSSCPTTNTAASSRFLWRGIEERRSGGLLTLRRTHDRSYGHWRSGGLLTLRRTSDAQEDSWRWKHSWQELGGPLTLRRTSDAQKHSWQELGGPWRSEELLTLRSTPDRS